MKPLPFQQAPPSGGHIVGQPITVHQVSIPVTMVFRCNCPEGGADLVITESTAVTCPLCRRSYNATFDPTKMSLSMLVQNPEPEKVPS